MKAVVRNGGWVLAVAVIAAALFLLPGRTAIAPRIQADNNYIYLAADRLYAGCGLTSLYPSAPLQPWEWHADWVFLTQWPPGYPLLLCGVRFLLRCTTVEAGLAIAVVSCAVGLVAWFAWVRRLLPKGPAAALLAVVAAGSAVSTSALINPATDTIVVALLPLVLLLVQFAVSDPTSVQETRAGRRRLVRFLAIGLFAGALCWIRYAAIYAPAGIGLYLIAEWLVRRRVGFKQVAVFGVAAAVPVAALPILNHVFGAVVPLQEQYNLGSGVGFAPDPTVLTTIWWQFTDLPFYDYHWYSHWVFALAIPVGVVGFVCLRSSWRQAARSFVVTPGFILSACVVVALFLMLASVSMFFRSKHTYVDIPRYYAAAKPLYFLLFVGPLLSIPRKSVRALACVPLLLCCSWYLQVEWPRPYERWLAADRAVTDYGRWAVCFEPGSTQLYGWLREQDDSRLVVFSSFHDEIALETWIPANPLPETEEQLTRWVSRIRQARDIDEPCILFVLDPSNHTREYFLPSPEEVIARFALTPHPTAPESIRQYVYTTRAATGKRMANGTR